MTITIKGNHLLLLLLMLAIRKSKMIWTITFFIILWSLKNNQRDNSHSVIYEDHHN